MTLSFVSHSNRPNLKVCFPREIHRMKRVMWEHISRT